MNMKDSSASQSESATTAAVRDVITRMGLDAPAEDVASELAHAGVRVSTEQVDRIRASLAAGATSKAPSPASDSEWTQHEHVSQPSRMDAQRLVDQAGTPELAKHAIDSVTEEPTGRDGSRGTTPKSSKGP